MTRRRLSVSTRSAFLGLAVAASALASGPLVAQAPTATFTHWDIPLVLGRPTSQLGGIVARAASGPDSGVWFVSRAPYSRLFRLTPGAPVETGTATWQAWDFDDPAQSPVGLEVTDAGVAFIRNSAALERIDSASNVHTRWLEGGGRSDLALDADGGVWSASHPFVKRLLPDGPSSAGATLTTWMVDNGAGEEQLAGVALRSAAGRFVYYVEVYTNQIGELDPVTARVRRWPLAAVAASGPRQLAIDTCGAVWVVTASNHLVRLVPTTNQLTGFLIPTPGADPYGVDADARVGFTELGSQRTGALLSGGTPVEVLPTVGTAPRADATLVGTQRLEVPRSGSAEPVTVAMPATTAGTPATGVFVEAQTPPGSLFPYGIDGDPSGAPGTFYYTPAVTLATGWRVGRVILPGNAAVPGDCVAACPPARDDDHDGLDDDRERLFGALPGVADSDGDGKPDGNDDGDEDGQDDEDEDDDDDCPDPDSDDDGTDDEDEDDDDEEDDDD
jgi:streptogramin lyase